LPLRHHALVRRPSRTTKAAKLCFQTRSGFLDAWLRDRAIDDCVEAGQSRARATLAHRGAILL
ncbi:MAG: hypothetical protein VX247_08540, partial [Pseudomonadota bacterium]|nr:hypothetical protein [Pseudomonadota bacterium]